MDPSTSAAREALDDLILGRGVRRGRHEIPPEAVALFVGRLVALGFAPLTVGAVEMEVGVRVPAWLLRGPRVDFGWILWEIFTETKRRKLFGSEVRNAKGDWEIQLNPGSAETLWAHPGLAERYDASRPVGLW